ncbi:MAG: hypothetical protein KDD70_14855, partial [Bdellovibrionales bacterium]|nr:hypothetical protein [Bdellovibrionales bacterium]
MEKLGNRTHLIQLELFVKPTFNFCWMVGLCLALVSFLYSNNNSAFASPGESKAMASAIADSSVSLGVERALARDQRVPA